MLIYLLKFYLYICVHPSSSTYGGQRHQVLMGLELQEILRKLHMGAKSQTLSSVRAVSPAHF